MINEVMFSMLAAISLNFIVSCFSQGHWISFTDHVETTWSIKEIQVNK